ncbi:hypothetical protein BDV97DRAFT_346538 [Delphinella strobiligena]|nr:hypothetical protein BDV97DRAFT_346538 [Delphinella strobiligena]
MAKDQESKESQALDNTKGQLSFVIFDQASSSNGSNSRRIRSHAARRGWTVRKENSKKKTKTLADGPRSDLANPISLASAPPARESRSRRKLQREGNARRNRNRGFLETVLNEEYPIGLSFGSPSNPFSVYPVPWKPVFAPLIDLGLHWAGSVWGNVANHNWSSEQCARLACWPLEVCIESCEPAAFYSIMASAATALPVTHPLAPRNTPRLSHFLQTKAIEALNAAFSCSDRAVSTPILLSILCLAGIAIQNQETGKYVSHYLPALKRMTDMRGGIAKIANDGENGRILARRLASADRVFAPICGNEQFFPEYEDPVLESIDWTNIFGRVQEESDRRRSCVYGQRRFPDSVLH